MNVMKLTASKVRQYGLSPNHYISIDKLKRLGLMVQPSMFDRTDCTLFVETEGITEVGKCVEVTPNVFKIQRLDKRFYNESEGVQ